MIDRINAPSRAAAFAPLLLMVGLLAPAAHGQVRLEKLKVALWPEYDRPEVLVMISAWLAPDTPLPALVSLPMPAAAGEPHAVAKRESDGNLLVAQHTVDIEGQAATIGVLTDVPEVRLEYYVPASRVDDLRSYRFDWPGRLEIAGDTDFEVLEPVGASGMIVTPAASAARGNDGLTYYRGRIGPLSKGEALSITVAYVKSGSALVVAGEAASAAPAEVAPGEPTATQTSLWLTVAAIVFAILIGLAIGLRWLRSAS